MKILLAGEIDDTWRRELRAALPEADWDADDAQADVAVVANPPPGALAAAPRLRLIQSLWAGVDRLLGDASVPPGVPLARMVDPVMNAAMAETALWATLALHRGFFDYARQQRQGLWRALAQRRADEVQVLVLGQGQMGRTAATRLQQQGYRVTGWRHGVDLPPLLAQSQVVINLLPLTAQTRSLLDAGFFAAMPRGASIVNLGRGGHVVDADLLAALDSAQLQHAVLDVFQTEPLPADHRYWSHPKLTLLPHAAALTDPRSASAVVAANLRALRDGLPVKHLVDRSRGY
jgi:glyoxylate/hydroxypyruvate reductase A